MKGGKGQKDPGAAGSLQLLALTEELPVTSWPLLSIVENGFLQKFILSFYTGDQLFLTDFPYPQPHIPFLLNTNCIHLYIQQVLSTYCGPASTPEEDTVKNKNALGLGRQLSV